MLHRKMVFILGAGASISYGFPSGHELFVKIRDMCRHAAKGNYDHLADAGCDIQKVIELGHAIDRTDFRSIDAFLARYDEFMSVGKTLIAFALLPHERREAFTVNTQHTNWMLYLFERMEGKTIEDFAKNPVTFVTFNYDRSLDFYLAREILNRYKATSAQLNNFIKAIPIIHVHGSLGTLGEVSYGGFEPLNNGATARKAGNGITILHEAVRASEEFKTARKALRDTERIAFMGFGFHPTNMDRLDLEHSMVQKSVYATRKDVTDPELTEFKRRNIGGNLTLEDGDSVALLRNTKLLY